MTVKWKNLLCYLLAVVFIIAGIVLYITPVEEQVFSGYTTGAPDYDPIFITVVTFPYRGQGVLCVFVGLVLLMIAISIEFKEKNEKEHEWESPLLRKEKKEREDDRTLREWIEDEKSAT